MKANEAKPVLDWPVLCSKNCF